MANNDAWQAGLDIGAGHKSGDQDMGKQRRKKRGQGGGGGQGGAGGGNPWSILSYIPKLHKGGRVRKSGVYRLKKGETVVRAKHRGRKQAGSKRTVVKA